MLELLLHLDLEEPYVGTRLLHGSALELLLYLDLEDPGSSSKGAATLFEEL
jgi:hypothetical protein